VPRPQANFVALGCDDGSIAMVQVVFSTVHGLYGDRWVGGMRPVGRALKHAAAACTVWSLARDAAEPSAVRDELLCLQLACT
jgi:intraflagellar transport protein 122